MTPSVRHPHEVAGKIKGLLELFLSLDVTLYNIVIDWLQPLYGWSISESIVQSAMREIACPLEFSVYNGKSCLASFVQSRETSDEDESVNSESEFASVPYTSLDDELEGFTAATIIEGDLVKLLCRSAITWVVYEIRPEQKMMILAVHKREIFDGSELKTRNDIVEKRTFPASAFIGSIVWREELVALESNDDDCDDQSTTYDESSISSQGSSQIYTRTTECHVFQMPVISSAVVLQQMRVMIKEQNNLRNNDEYEQKPAFKRLISSNKSPSEVPQISSLIFLKPTTPSVLMLERLKAIVREMAQLPQKNLSKGFPCEKKVAKLMHPKKLLSSELHQHTKKPLSSEVHQCPGNPTFNHRITIQDQAQAKTWLTRKKDLFDARRFLWRSDPFSCCLDSQRDRWLLTCRALRAISRGDEDLLGDFYRWTYSAGDEGIIRAKDCRKAWYSLRCLTTR
jgi:hypothetical protein